MIFKHSKTSSISKITYNLLLASFCSHKNGNNDIQIQNVNKVYDKIAKHFSQTRYKPWPKVADFLYKQQKGNVVLDLGCGNGRNMKVNSKIQIFGIDICQPLLNIANSKNNLNLMRADATKLPIRSQSFDAFICIALLHHFSSKQMRLAIIKQLSRTIKINGKGLIYVRSLQLLKRNGQLKRQLENQDFFDPWHLQIKYEDNLEQAIKNGHKYIPEKQSIIYERYYHTFAKGELDQLIKKVPQFQITKSYYDSGNWACVVSKRK